MREAWKDILVQDLVDAGQAELKTGPFGTQLHASDYVEHGTPVINVRNIGFGEIRDGDLEFINAKTVNRLSGHLLQANDIVFGRKGAVERHVFIRKKYTGWFQGSDCLRLRVSSPDAEPQFLSYCFQTEFHKQWMMNHSSHGATMTSLNQEIICRIPLHLPPIKIQRKFITILSAYDDLIVNNARRIQILERMAQALYREWFVNFRFPGHAKVKLVASPLGKIPQGWEATRIGAVIETLGGGTPSTKNPAYWDNGTINWYSPSDLTAAGALFVAESSRKITELGLQESSAKMFPANCVMMTSRATIGVVSINTAPATTNQGFVTCVPNARLSAYHIVEWIKQNMDLIIGVASGATFKEISRGEFRDLSIVLPPESLQREYAITVDPMYQEVRVLLAKDANLRRTRDLLLPKLISGALDVSKLDIETT